MVELVVVMVVLGIVAAIGFSKMADRGSFDSRAYADQVRSVIRYAQRTAISQRRTVTVVANATMVAACYGAPCTANNIVRAPGGANSGSRATQQACRINGVSISQWLCEGVPSGVAVTQFGATTFTFGFSGAPAGFSGLQQATISGGGSSHVIRIDPSTGYVY